jgi:hypothetical protein
MKFSRQFDVFLLVIFGKGLEQINKECLFERIDEEFDALCMFIEKNTSSGIFFKPNCAKSLNENPETINDSPDNLKNNSTDNLKNNSTDEKTNFLYMSQDILTYRICDDNYILKLISDNKLASEFIKLFINLKKKAQTTILLHSLDKTDPLDILVDLILSFTNSNMSYVWGKFSHYETVNRRDIF